MLKEVSYICDWSAGTDPLDAKLILNLLNAKVEINVCGTIVQQQLTLAGSPVNQRAFGFVFNADAVAQIKKDHPSYEALQQVINWDYVLPKENKDHVSTGDTFGMAKDPVVKTKTLH